MSDIADVASCLKKIKTKNLGQNKNNLINSLSKDYGYSKESANKIIEQGKYGKNCLFNGKNSYRIVENGENTIIVPETQQNDTQLNDTDATEAISDEGNGSAIEDTVVGTSANILNDEIISTLERKFETFPESIESRFLKGICPYLPVRFVFFLKSRLLFNIFYCFCMFVSKHFRYLGCS